MDAAGLDKEVGILKKTRIKQLRPELREEVMELAKELGYEETVKETSSLHALYRIYNAEKMKERRSRKLLKKAENLIMKLAGLYHGTVSAEVVKPTEKKKGGMKGQPLAEEVLPFSKKLIEALQNIGITNPAVIKAAVDARGESEIETRAEYVREMIRQHEKAMRKFFSVHPKTLYAEEDQSRFTAIFDAILTKKMTVDAWAKTNNKQPPAWANYNVDPTVLLEEDSRIQMLLGIPVQEVIKRPDKIRAGEIEYRSIPMGISDFDKVLNHLGWVLVSEKQERKFRKNMPDGTIRNLTTSKPHDREFDPVTIRKIIKDMGNTPIEFEIARREALGWY